MSQGDNKVEVFYERLPKEVWKTILSQKNFSDAKISVTGIVQKFKNKENTYYIDAKSVIISEPRQP